MEQIGPRTQVGTDKFVSDAVAECKRRAGCGRPDLQAAQQILAQCASSRCHHLLTTFPLSQSSEYAILHDAGTLRAMKSLLGGVLGEPQEKERCLSPCHSAHANGRVGSQVSDPDGSSSKLGLGAWCKRGFPLEFNQLWSTWKLQQNLLVACDHLPSLTLSTVGRILHLLPLLNTITKRSFFWRTLLET